VEASAQPSSGEQTSGAVPVRRALISVSDKTGVVEFARGLAELGIEIVSTGGTGAALREGGVEVRDVSDLTGSPEILDGRVKTLHPRLHAGLLAVRDDPEHQATLEAEGIEPIDLVCVNLYPFEKTVAGRDVGEQDAIENIDIGGPTMIRAAAKNHRWVAVVVKPESYDAVLAELQEQGGSISSETRHWLANEAFAFTARYDAAISRWFSLRYEAYPGHWVMAHEKFLDLSYGENPHQSAALYVETGARSHVLSRVAKLHGRALSFNNVLDLDAASKLLAEFEEPAAVIVKHNNPCGAAVGDTITEAFGRAFACDPLAAFGGIIAIRGRVDGAVASLVLQHFVEVVAADDFTEEAIAFFGKKPNVRLLRLPVSRRIGAGLDWKRIDGGLLLQDADSEPDQISAWRVASQRKPTVSERAACELAWKVVRRVKSNAIVLANARQTIGIGAGQMSRVDACHLAATKPVLPIVNCGAASDAFFPFRDGVEILADAGVTAVVAPGGSIRDPEIVAAADELNLAFLIAPKRHFRH
jgi:phosphoribosylaminoimidazolecarboxamide formyltransferase/IMP cyclohydrolase